MLDLQPASDTCINLDESLCREWHDTSKCGKDCPFYKGVKIQANTNEGLINQLNN